MRANSARIMGFYDIPARVLTDYNLYRWQNWKSDNKIIKKFCSFTGEIKRCKLLQCLYENLKSGLAFFFKYSETWSSVKPVYLMMTSSNRNIFLVTGRLCGEFTGPGEFPTQRPVTRSLDVFFDLRLNKRLSKQPWGWWFETPSWSLWCHCNVVI